MHSEPSAETMATAAPLEETKLLQLCLEQRQPELLQALRRFSADSFVRQGDVPKDSAVEMLAEVAQRAITGSATFDPSRAPLPWLMRIALNVARRRYREGQTRQRREIHLEDPAAINRGDLSDSQFFDRLSALSVPSPEVRIIDHAALDGAIAALSSIDQEIIKTTLEWDWDMQKVAEALGIKAGTARVRLHRAIPRLKTEYTRQD